MLKSEQKRNIRSAFLYGILTIAAIGLFIFVGIPIVAKFTAFLGDINKSSQPVEKNDTTPPAPPRLDTLPEVTNRDSIEIKGSTEEGAIIIIFANDKKDEILAGKDGFFTYTFKLDKGENTISAFAIDTSGNEGQKTEIFKIIFDDKPPSLEITKPNDGNEYFGARQRLVAIEGTTENDTTVTINDRLVVVNEGGNFAFATTLSEGENKFTIKAKDKAENETEKSLTLRFSL